MKIRTQIQTILIITLCWMSVAIGLGLHDFYLLQAKSLLLFLTPYIFLSIVGGVSGGGFLMFFLHEKIRRLPLSVSVFGAAAACSALFLPTLALIFWANASLPLGKLAFFEDARPIFFSPFLSSALAQILSLGFLLSALTAFFLRVGEKYGQGVLWNFLSAKFYAPKSEEKIFMFLDIKSSTKLAEQMGYTTYFFLLANFFEDLTKIILNHSGVIYQAVGDELVITWDLNAGLREANAVRCFFEMEKALQAKANVYLEKYGVVPEFKAGMHCGKIVTGEIGVFKKDIVHLGEAVTTAARIQNVCNHYSEKFLISAALFNSLSLPKQFEVKAIENVGLKGKRAPMTLFAIRKSEV